MSTSSTESFVNRYGNMLIIVSAVVVLVGTLLWFLDRRDSRNAETRRLDQRIDVLEEWGPPWQAPARQNTQQRQGGGGKVL